MKAPFRPPAGRLWGRESFRVAGREAVFLLVSAILLGLIYTGITQKGLFSRSQGLRLSSPSAGPKVAEVITLEDAKVFHASGKALFIDTRGEGAFMAGHIPDAINVPIDDLEEEIDFLREASQEKILIPYCDGSGCHSSLEFSRRLADSGISNIKIFLGGWDEWKAARLPIVSP